MVSAIGIAQVLSQTVHALSQIAKPVLLPVLVLSLVHGAYAVRHEIADFVTWFLGSPGRTSRVIALLVLIINWKSVPFVWTVSIPPIPTGRPSVILLSYS
jgi:hypothetical protein